MTVIISGNDYVLYSMLKVSNVSLNIILSRGVNFNALTHVINLKILMR